MSGIVMTALLNSLREKGQSRWLFFLQFRSFLEKRGGSEFLLSCYEERKTEKKENRGKKT
jgi:hypothetical protein